MLVGNKLDLEEKRQVNFESALKLAKKLGLAGVVETSAKEGTPTLDDAFFIVAANSLDQKMHSSMIFGSTLEET